MSGQANKALPPALGEHLYTCGVFLKALISFPFVTHSQIPVRVQTQPDGEQKNLGDWEEASSLPSKFLWDTLPGIFRPHG